MASGFDEYLNYMGIPFGYGSLPKLPTAPRNNSPLGQLNSGITDAWNTGVDFQRELMIPNLVGNAYNWLTTDPSQLEANKEASSMPDFSDSLGKGRASTTAQTRSPGYEDVLGQANFLGNTTPDSHVFAFINGKKYDYSNGRSGGAPKLRGRVGGESVSNPLRRKPDSYNTPGFSNMEVSGNTPGARQVKREAFNNEMEDREMANELAIARMTPQQRVDLQARSRAKIDPNVDYMRELMGTPDDAGKAFVRRFIAEQRAKAPNQPPQEADLQAAYARGVDDYHKRANELTLGIATRERDAFPQQ